MRTRSSSNLVGESSPNKTSSNLRRRNRRRSKQPFILEESLIDTMADQRTMAELLRAPTDGYAEAIVVPPILAERFELKHSLINMVTLDQFFRLEKDNPHDHIHCDANSSSSFELAKLTHAVNQQTSVVTTAMTTILKQFQATPPPSFVKSAEEICVTCGGAHPYYQCLDADGNTFPEYRDNIQGYVSAAVVNYNLAKLTYTVNQQTSVVTTVMTAILKQFQATPPPAPVKAIEEVFLLVVVLICIISVSPPTATLS
nr:reverse transcriptase domain-containing protein [Tanacetum cinerariifolium]